jgi:hypothetical protein
MSEVTENAEEQDLLKSDFKKKRQPLSRNNKLIIGILAAVLMCALGLAIPFLLQTSEPAVLTVTVFSNDWSEVVLKPGVETALNEYLASDSSVPGFPLRTDYPGADNITLTVDAGMLFTWGDPDYIAHTKGQTYSVAANGTVYWSPFDADNTAVPQCTLNVSAQVSGSQAAAVRLIIRRTGETGYSITLLANE